MDQGLEPLAGADDLLPDSGTAGSGVDRAASSSSTGPGQHLAVTATFNWSRRDTSHADAPRPRSSRPLNIRLSGCPKLSQAAERALAGPGLLAAGFRRS